MAVETPGMPGAFIYCSGFSGTYQKTSDMCPESGGFIITVSTTAGQEPQQFPTIEPLSSSLSFLAPVVNPTGVLSCPTIRNRARRGVRNEVGI